MIKLLVVYDGARMALTYRESIERLTVIGPTRWVPYMEDIIENFFHHVAPAPVIQNGRARFMDITITYKQFKTGWKCIAENYSVDVVTGFGRLIR